MGYMYLLDGNWETYPDGMYYDLNIKTCNSWGDNWNAHWGYRDAWFLWPDGEMIDIETMTWITDCSGQHFQTTYTLQSNSSTINLCRPLTYYYVDPDSEQIMEFGTIEYPFRDINLVFIEVFNEHQHTDRNISIYVKELTKNYLPTDFIEIVNTTMISIDSYTHNELMRLRMLSLIWSKTLSLGTSQQSKICLTSYKTPSKVSLIQAEWKTLSYQNSIKEAKSIFALIVIVSTSTILIFSVNHMWFIQM